MAEGQVIPHDVDALVQLTKRRSERLTTLAVLYKLYSDGLAGWGYAFDIFFVLLATITAIMGLLIKTHPEIPRLPVVVATMGFVHALLHAIKSLAALEARAKLYLAASEKLTGLKAAAGCAEFKARFRDILSKAPLVDVDENGKIESTRMGKIVKCLLTAGQLMTWCRLRCVARCVSKYLAKKKVKKEAKLVLNLCKYVCPDLA